MTREQLLEQLYDMAQELRVEIVQDEFGKLTVAFYPKEESD